MNKFRQWLCKLFPGNEELSKTKNLFWIKNTLIVAAAYPFYILSVPIVAIIGESDGKCYGSKQSKCYSYQ